MKRTIQLGKKACIVCSEEFQPASGAQMTCSADCKAEAKAKGLNKRRPRNGGVDPVLQEGEQISSPAAEGRVFFGGQEVSPPGHRALAARATDRRDEAPDLELDLSPLEDYVKALVEREVRSVEQPTREGGDLREMIREIVREELADKFRGILGR